MYVWICEDDGDSDKKMHMGERSPLWDYLRLKLNIIGMKLNIRLVVFDGTHSADRKKAFNVLETSQPRDSSEMYGVKNILTS